ncbi:MAG: chemotaxis-specific protein-glutamate methyltransferase CheB [Deltaproteobacteria bacterium]|nr:chemotaxis-specific protein-glutamate methyltransferase CheB [Deltaproteobacteria bacterium]
MSNEPIRLLIIDDSAYNRKSIAEFFDGNENVQVVGKAADGQEGLQLAMNLKPTVITLDLEMPRLDGFGFLRILMSGQPTPVIVISSHSQKENVFRALELGALDFVAKPSTMISPAIKKIREDVVQKVMAAGKFNAIAMQSLTSGDSATGMFPLMTFPEKDEEEAIGKPAEKVVVIGASTGGPASLTKVLSTIPAHLNAAIVIAQHMPAQFTATFAARLDRLFQLRVLELQQGEVLKNGSVYISPGDANIKISRVAEGYFGEKVPRSPKCRYSPCVDQMFISAANAVREKLLAVVMTGMGNDGAAGCEVIHAAGGSVIVESEDTAIVFGMPQAVLEAGVPAKVRPLHMISGAISAFSRKKPK